MATALITGGSGFVGSHLCNELHRQGWRVYYTGKDGENSPPGVRVGYCLYRIPWRRLPLIDAVFHQAAITDTTCHDRERLWRVNVYQPLNLFLAALRHSWPVIVYASSASVYGNIPAPFREGGPLAPLCPYAESKAALDTEAMRLAADTGAVIVGLRYSNVYGMGEEHKNEQASMVSRLLWQMREGNPRLFKHGEQRRDWVYVKDIVQANLLASRAERSDIYNVGSGEATSFNELVRLWNRYLLTDRQPTYIDNVYHRQYQAHTLLDINRAKVGLEYLPRFPIREGIEDYQVQFKLKG